MNTKRWPLKKFVRVVSPSAYRRLDNKINREKKQTNALRSMRRECEDEQE